MHRSSSAGFDIREAVEHLREAFAPRAGGRSPGSSHRDIRSAVLSALATDARNGHEVMQAIAAAHDGWMPAASEVYPTLQQLTDEGLVSARHDGERTVYALTDAGRAAAAAAEQAERTAHDDHAGDHAGDHDPWRLPRWDEHTAAVPKAGAKLAQAAAQVAQHGTREQKERAAALLDETRRQLYAILAED